MVLRRRSPENWLPVVGYEGLYSVSDHGRVRSEERAIKSWDGSPRRWKARILKSERNSQRYPSVMLYRDGINYQVRVHILVTEAFIGPCPDGQWVRHLDDDPKNNHISNLAYGTPADNGLDRVVNTPACRQGHLLVPENIYIRPDTGQRQCRECRLYHTRKHYGSSTFQERVP